MLSPADIPLPVTRLIVLQPDPGKGAAYFHPFLYQNQVIALGLCELRDYMKESMNRRYSVGVHYRSYCGLDMRLLLWVIFILLCLSQSSPRALIETNNF
jgi:hypothetical protein